MPTLDFTSYFPASGELTADQIAASRAKIEALLVDGVDPTPDVRPGSVLGDLVVSQMALADAARGEAARRLLSDLDTEQLEHGTVYNCDVAKAWLSNFTRPGELRKTRGVIRLTFLRSGFYTDVGVSDDGFLALNRGIQFLFNDTDIFKVSLPHDEDNYLRVVAPGEPRLEGALNFFMAEETTDGNLQVDLPVLGSSAEGVTAGESGLIDWKSDILLSVTAVTDFAAQEADSGIKAQASRVRQTFYASSLATRAGAAGMVLSEFGDASVVSPVTNGDRALTRGNDDTLLLIQKPCLDVYVRSDVLLTGTAVVRIPVVVQPGDSEYAGAAPVSFGHVPVDIVNFALTDRSSLGVEGEGAPSSGDHASIWLASTSTTGQIGHDLRTARELFVLCLRIHEDDLASAVNEDYEVRVTVTYRYDPLLLQVASLVEAPRNAPAGVSVEVRSFQPFDMTSLIAEYYRTNGKTVSLGLASEEIVTSVNRTGWPDTFTRTAINDSLLYAGARGVRDVLAEATLRPSVATHRFPGIGLPLLPGDVPVVVPGENVGFEGATNYIETGADPETLGIKVGWVVSGTYITEGTVVTALLPTGVNIDIGTEDTSDGTDITFTPPGDPAAAWDDFLNSQSLWPVLEITDFRSLNPETVTSGMTDFGDIEDYLEDCDDMGIPFGNRILRWMLTADNLELREVTT